MNPILKFTELLKLFHPNDWFRTKKREFEEMYLSNVFYMHVQKDGNEAHEYEDSYRHDMNNLLFCVADGTTESSFSKEWADLLTEEFVNTSNHSKNDLKIVLRKMRKKAKNKWHNWLKNKTIPWHAEEKVKRGADAAFIGLKILPEISVWKAVSVGDCCLFIIRDDKLIEKFPIEVDSDFDNTPSLIGSVFALGKNDIKVKSGDLTGGEIIYLLSDAIAQWFLKNQKKQSWKIINDNFENKDIFQVFIDKLRKNKEIKNDDITVMIITIPHERI